MDAGRHQTACRTSSEQGMETAHYPQAALAHCVDQVLRSRRSTRAYKPDPVSAETILDILDCAATAPSNSNTQPWRVHVLAGAPMRELGDALVASFRENLLPPSFHFPDPLPAEFGERQADFAARYYGCLGIDRQDAAARSSQTEKNFHFFGAPVGLIFSIDARLAAHSWLDLGLFVQNVMIAAGARGLATCPQVSFARFHDCDRFALAHAPAARDGLRDVHGLCGRHCTRESSPHASAECAGVCATRRVCSVLNPVQPAWSPWPATSRRASTRQACHLAWPVMSGCRRGSLSPARSMHMAPLGARAAHALPRARIEYVVLRIVDGTVYVHGLLNWIRVPPCREISSVQHRVR